ncbi:MAG: hypothetical protein MK289_16390 [Trichodesmium sp. ALOHA_ZT_67]|nr:hypothetical protein [Trichodesmium sp. ALOHA_ZT_67]
MMVQYRFIQLARQGNSKAIATLLNNKLHSKGINAKVSVVNNCLYILLESDELPERSIIIYIVRNQLLEVKLDAIKIVKLSFKRYIDKYPTWGQTLDLKLNSLSSLKLASSSDNKQSVFSQKNKINPIKNQRLNNLRISILTLGIFMIILFISLVVFIGKNLVKQSSQTPNRGTTYPEVLPTE